MEEKKTWEDCIKDETLWLWIALALAGLTVVGTIFAIPFVSYPSGDNEKVKVHIEITKLFGTALIAALTFSTVVWRGLVGARQANEQKRANDAKDEENAAKLLVDGAKLLGDPKKEHVVAAIAALELVITSRRSQYAKAAMNILADFVQSNISANSNHELVKSAVQAMQVGARDGFIASRQIEVRTPDSEYIKYWLDGFEATKYIGGKFAYQGPANHDLEHRYFQGVEFNNWHFQNEPNATDCSFKSSTFKEMDIQLIRENHFLKCDFSDAAISKTMFEIIYWEQPIDFIETKLRGCYYYQGSKPSGNGAHSILQHLDPREPRHPRLERGSTPQLSA